MLFINFCSLKTVYDVLKKIVGNKVNTEGKI